MILLENVSKISEVAGKKRVVLLPTSLAIPSDRRIALLGRNEQDKRILIETLSGVVLPTTGHIARLAKTSFPVGDLPGFELKVPLRVNLAYVARLYEIDPRQIAGFVEKIMGMREYLDKPYKQFPVEARRTLGQVVGLGVPFDAYLLREDKMRGDLPVRQKMWAVFESRSRTSGVIVPTADDKFVRKYCDMAMVLDGGRITLLNTIEEGLAWAGRSDPETAMPA